MAHLPGSSSATTARFEFFPSTTLLPADALAAFVTTYELPAAIVQPGADPLSVENGEFATLRAMHPTLPQALYHAVGEGKTRTKTILGERTIRWTLTSQPETEKNGHKAVVVLAQDTGKKDDDEGEDAYTEFSPGEHMPFYDRAKGPALEEHGANRPPPRVEVKNASAGPSILNTSSSSSSPPLIDRSWSHDPRFTTLLETTGEMSELIRNWDWASTPLGPVSSWSPTLVATYGIILHSRFPSCIVWGPHRVLLYNTPYIPILGHTKHPHALARPVKETWSENYETFHPLHERVFRGESLFFEDTQIFLSRSTPELWTRPEEAHITFGYIPVYELDGTIGGFYAPAMDTTPKIRTQRRMDALRQLAKGYAGARTISSLLSSTRNVLQDIPDDVPYAAIYTVQRDEDLDGRIYDSRSRRTFVLQETIGIPFGERAAPHHIVVDRMEPGSEARPARPVDLQEMIDHLKVIMYSGVEGLLSGLPQRGALPARPNMAAALPVTDGEELVGCVIVYLGASQPLDDLFKRFLDMLSRQISVGVTTVTSHQMKERKLEEMASIKEELERKMEEQLRNLDESRESYTRLSERLQVGIHRSDSTGRVTWANWKWKAAFGLEDDVEPWPNSIHPEDVKKVHAAYLNAFTTKRGYSEPLEMRVRAANKEGEWIDILYDLQPESTSDTSGTVSSWVGVWYDVSNLRRLQRQAMEAERAHAAEADRNRELQEQFIDITCHELRNPLNAIYNSSIMLGESLTRIENMVEKIKPTDAGSDLWPTFAEIHAELQEDTDCAKTIVQCAKHQQRITDDVLNVSKLKAGLITISHEDFSPWDEVKDTIRMFREDAAARGVDLQIERDGSLDMFDTRSVRGDSGRFVQVVVNLVSNAIKFTETAPRREIRVRLGVTRGSQECSEDWPTLMDRDDLLPMCRVLGADDSSTSPLRLYVAVADTGHGMTQEEQDRLFQRFAQASPRTYGEFGGSGLGLYVSRMLVELHGGRIHLQSAKNAGTVLRFFITVKRSVEELKKEAGPTLFPSSKSRRASTSGNDPANVNDSNDRKLRVLVVEDNLINQRLLVKLLKSLGCTTGTCNDGQECVNLFGSSLANGSEPQFDLILMDMEMPTMNGLEATRQIRRLEEASTLTYSVPIVAVSGNARPEWAERARDAGMDGFIRKPYGKAELEAVVGSWRRRGRTVSY